MLAIHSLIQVIQLNVKAFKLPSMHEVLKAIDMCSDVAFLFTRLDSFEKYFVDKMGVANRKFFIFNVLQMRIIVAILQSE